MAVVGDTFVRMLRRMAPGCRALNEVMNCSFGTTWQSGLQYSYGRLQSGARAMRPAVRCRAAVHIDPPTRCPVLPLSLMRSR